MTAVPEDEPDGRLDALAERARALIPAAGRAILGITGSPGAGKTTLVEQLLERLAGEPVAHVPMDGYHLADVQLDRLGIRDRKGAPETFDAGGYVALLRRLKAADAEVVYVPGFERDLEQPLAAALHVPAEARLVITEGNYLLLPDHPWSEVRTIADEVWFVDLDERVRLDRLVDRHVRFGKEPEAAVAWARGTDQRNAVLVAATRAHATLVVTGR